MFENETCRASEDDPHVICGKPATHRVGNALRYFLVCAEHAQAYRLDPDMAVCSIEDAIVEEVERKLIEKKKIATGTGGDIRIQSGTGTSVGSGGLVSLHPPAPSLGGVITFMLGGQKIVFPTKT